MDRQQFDDLARALAESSATRRTAFRVLTGSTLAAIGLTSLADATAQARGDKKVKNEGDRGGQKSKWRCRYAGKICFRKPKKGTPSEQSGCTFCCGGSFRPLNGRKGRCCNHDGLPCATTNQCCLGDCVDSTCQSNVIYVPPPPPPTCVSYGGVCTPTTVCCSGVPCTGNNEGQNFTCRYP